MVDPFERPARPWDLYNKKIGRVDTLTAEQRLDICKACTFFIKTTSQCKKCGCLMTAKTKLPNAECPIGKWGQTKIEEEII